ncbi:MAG: SusC/RagA family TonB-linked outer membrane protein [Balneolaceae bacterium]|nr:SusC/RagA family TonB-linked outer membrane protein [Balneolaceae bacterium]
MKTNTILMKLLAGVFFIMAFAVFEHANAQRVISGTVTSEDDGEALTGVNVVIQGTQMGVVTDLFGEYEIQIEDDSQVLVFSMVGFQTYQTTVGTRSTINVSLEVSEEMLGELVVTAFGLTRERRSLGYSTTTVGATALTEARETNVVRNLRGRVAGAEISQSPVAGGSSGILLRGVGSITGDNMPLIVVDGVPIDNSQTQSPDVGWGGIDYGDGIGGVRADDIEEITVLKGPNASALYGARASNGVLLITTKTGRARTGIGVEFNSNVTFDQIGMKPQFQNRWASGYGMNWDDAWNTVTIDGQTYYEATGGTDSHGPELDGRMIVLRHRPDLGPVPATPQPRDNIYDFYNTGITANNAIAFSGGDQTTTYRVSFTDERNEGVVPNSEFSSNSVSLRITSNVTDRLRVDGRANYYRHEGTNRPGLGGQLAQNTFLNLQMTARFVDLKWLEDYKGPDGRPMNISSRYPSNPYWMVNERQNSDTRDRVYGFLSASFDITDWLNLNVRGGTDTYLDQRFMRAALYDPGDLDGRIENRAFRIQENNYDFLLNAMGNITDDFTGSFAFGGNYLTRSNEETSVLGTQLNIPGLYHINNANSRSTVYNLSAREMQSLYAMGQIGYRDILYLDLSARNDWSSTLGKGYESFFYPAASLAFVATDAFNIQSSVLTMARLRASYAQTGNDTFPYRTKAGYFLDSTDFNGIRMAGTPGTIPLVDLKNELTKSWEFGADIVLFNNRLSVDVATYFASTYNQIFSVPVSTTTGYGSRLINAGQIDNKGIELTLDARIIQTSNFAWNLGFNAARNRNMVVELAPGVEAFNIASGGQVTAQARPGQPFGDLLGWGPDYTEDGRMILNENGTLRRSSEQLIVGNMQPDFTGGIMNQVTYKGFSLSAVLDFRVGGDLVSMSMREGLMKGAGIHTQHREAEMYHDGVIPVFNEAGDIVEYRENDQPVDPIGFYPARVWGQFTPFWIVSGTYMSLNEMTLGYSFSPTFLSGTPLTNLRLSVVGRNLGYLILDKDLKKMGVPPLSSNSRSPAGMGFEENNFPLLRTIGFNVNVQF